MGNFSDVVPDPSGAKRFSLGDILSAYTGLVLLPKEGALGPEEVLSYMAGEDLFNVVMAHVKEECLASLAQQLPFLAKIKVPEFTDAQHIRSWLKKQEGIYGSHRYLKPLNSTSHNTIPWEPEVPEITQDGIGY